MTTLGPPIRDGLRRKEVLLCGLALATVFSVEVPVFQSATQYASVNAEDVMILLLAAFVVSRWYNSGGPALTRPPWRLSVALAAVSVWILVSVTAAVLAVGGEAYASVLWTLKWFEMVVAFLLIVGLLDDQAVAPVAAVTVGAGVLLTIPAVALSVTNTWRVGLTFGNPNTLAAYASFLVVVASAWLLFTDQGPPWWRRFLLVGAVSGILLLFLTGSRSGLLGFGAAAAGLAGLSWTRLSHRQLLGSGSAIVASLLLVPLVVPPEQFRRLYNWVEISASGVSLADNGSAASFRTRLELIERGITLVNERPIVGHGWFASPSRLGYFDVYPVTLAVDIGYVGLALMAGLHLVVLWTLLRARRDGAAVFGTAGLVWHAGLLVQSVGGAFPRSPQILLLTFLTVGFALAEADQPVDAAWRSNEEAP
jgi:O-antigen ligase